MTNRQPTPEALEAVEERRGKFREIGWAEPQHDYDRAKAAWDAQIVSDALALDDFAAAQCDDKIEQEVLHPRSRGGIEIRPHLER